MEYPGLVIGIAIVVIAFVIVAIVSYMYTLKG